MVSDGYLLPPVEMPDAESTRMTMLNCINWMDGYDYPKSTTGASCLLVFDDMCHLLRCDTNACILQSGALPSNYTLGYMCRTTSFACRFALKRRHLHEGIERFCTQARHVVDLFHFIKNHVGVW